MQMLIAWCCLVLAAAAQPAGTLSCDEVRQENTRLRVELAQLKLENGKLEQRVAELESALKRALGAEGGPDIDAFLDSGKAAERRPTDLDVRVRTVEPLELTLLERDRLAELESDVLSLRERLQAARDDLADMERENRKERRPATSIYFRDTRMKKKPHTTRAIAEARIAVGDLEQDLERSEQEILRLERLRTQTRALLMGDLDGNPPRPVTVVFEGTWAHRVLGLAGGDRIVVRQALGAKASSGDMIEGRSFTQPGQP